MYSMTAWISEIKYKTSIIEGNPCTQNPKKSNVLKHRSIINRKFRIVKIFLGFLTIPDFSWSLRWVLLVLVLMVVGAAGGLLIVPPAKTGYPMFFPG